MKNDKRMIDEAGALREHWYAAAQGHQVNAKKPLARRILGVDLVLWRGKDGKLACSVDRCLHRNAPLSEGDLFDGCIGCPYHGWTYDEAGTCVSIPSEGRDGKAASRQPKLRTFETLEAHGLVWVWMGKGAAHGVPFEMPYWQTPGFGAYYMETMFDNGVTNLVENFMDVPHTVFVHRSWFRTRAEKKVGMSVERTKDSVLVTYEQPQDSIGVTGRILNPKGLPMVHTDKFYMPNTTRVDYVFGDDERAFVITSTCTPISPFKTRVFTLISYKLGALNALARWLLPPYTRKVIQQDVEIMEIQGRNLQRFDGTAFHHTGADLLHTDIEALRDWARSGGGPGGPEPKVETVGFWI